MYERQMSAQDCQMEEEDSEEEDGDEEELAEPQGVEIFYHYYFLH